MSDTGSDNPGGGPPSKSSCMKRPVEESWPDGRHNSTKSLKSNENQVAPQVPVQAPTGNSEPSEVERPSITFRRSSVVNIQGHGADRTTATDSSCSDSDHTSHWRSCESSESESRESTPQAAPTTRDTRLRESSLETIMRYVDSCNRNSTPILQDHPDAPGTLAIPCLPIGSQPSIHTLLRCNTLLRGGEDPTTIGSVTNASPVHSFILNLVDLDPIPPSRQATGSSSGNHQSLPTRLEGDTQFTFQPPVDSIDVDEQTPSATQSKSQRKGKGKSKATMTSSAIDQAAFTLPPWPSRGPPANSADMPSLSRHRETQPDPISESSTTSRPLPGPGTNELPPNASGSIPNFQTSTLPSQPTENILATMMSLFTAGMDRLNNSVQQSHESSHKFLHNTLAVLREELRAAKEKPQELEANPKDRYHVQISEDIFVPTVSRGKTKRYNYFVPSTNYQGPGNSAVKSKEDLIVHNRFVRAVRQHTLALLRIKDYKYLRTIKCTLTEDENDAFNCDLPGHIEVSASEFMVDCAHPRISSFNTAAAEVFAEDFLDKVTNHSWYSTENIPVRYLDVEVIKSAFVGHMSYIKTSYRRNVVLPEEDLGGAHIARSTRLQKSARLGRKGRLTCQQLLKMRLEAMVGDPELQKHVPLIKYLGTQAMSSDESEEEHKRTISYPRVYPRWRNDQLAAILWQADTLSERNNLTPIGHRKRGGTQLRLRPHSHNFNEAAVAPIGLPHNCYDPEWLSGLTEKAKKELKAQDKDYGYLLGEEEMDMGTFPPADPTGSDEEMYADDEEEAGSA